MYLLIYVRTYISLVLIYVHIYSASKQLEFSNLNNTYDGDFSIIAREFGWDSNSLQALEETYRTSYEPRCHPEELTVSWNCNSTCTNFIETYAEISKLCINAIMYCTITVEDI